PKDIDAVASVPFHPTPAARVMLALVCLSGVTSFTYEVLWTRLLSHVLGGSVYAFATMLATFLTGIAVGSAIASRLAQRQADAARYFCFTQLGIALSSAATFFLLDRVPEWAHAVGASAGTAHLANATISAAVLLPSTLFIGATFPLAVRFVTSDGREAGAASAATYAWNTGGAILGALLAAFVLIPVLKYHGTLIAVVAANVVLAWAATRLSRGMPRSETLAVFAGGIAVIVAASLLSPPWRLLTASPVARQGAVSGTQISHYYGVGRSAVVLALQSAGGLRVYSNGLPEANVRLPGHPRAPGGGWLGTLPSLMRPDVEHMLVIGFGAGTALEQIPQTVQRIDVVELEPEVLSACRAIANVRAQDPLADPRLQLRINDARGALLLTDARYDAIVSQPSHPWTAGASHLYTRNFFEQVAEHLDDDGVFVQWMGLSWVDEELLRALLATLDAVFEHVNVLMPAPYHELYFVASNAPLEAEAAVRKLVAEVPEDARRLGILGPEDLFVELAFDEHAVRRLAAGAQVSTDDHNLLQLRSPTLLGQEAESRWGSRIFVEHDSRDRQVAGLNTAYLTRRLLDRFDAAGARRLAAIEKDPAQRALSAAWLQDGVRGGLTPQSWQRLDTLLQQFPDSESVQVAWAQSQLARYRPGQQLPTPQLQQLTPRVRALLDASTAMAIGNWPAVAQLETSLASFERFDPGFKTATRLRARWRGMASDPENSRAAVALLDSLPDLTLDDRMQRAELLLRAGEPDAALNATGAIVQQLAATLERNPQLPKSPVLPRAQAVLGRIPETPQRRNQLQATRAVMHRVMQP
ncbi:MAG: fused MFS/spermidine synthase, partial [Planctomycetota bacterium]